MLRFGAGCKNCQGQKGCTDPVGPAAPITLECPGCNGFGCSECDDVGSIDIIECPLNIIDYATRDVIEYAILYEKGLPPIAGGALDQTANFIEAAAFVFAERAKWKAKLGIIG